MNKKKFKGSAILWAICTLLIFMIIITGIISLNQQYVIEEINSYSEKKAEYIARSGVDIISDEIMSKKLESYLLDDKATFSVSLKLEDGVECDVQVEKNGKFVTVISTSKSGDREDTVCSKLKKQNDEWCFLGYYIY